MFAFTSEMNQQSCILTVIIQFFSVKFPVFNEYKCQYNALLHTTRTLFLQLFYCFI
jgi:hypothetical protein